MGEDVTLSELTEMIINNTKEIEAGILRNPDTAASSVSVIATLHQVRQLASLYGNMLNEYDVFTGNLHTRLHRLEALPGVVEALKAPSCEFCQSSNDVQVQDMGEDRTMRLCASCRQHIAEGNARSQLQPCKHCGTLLRPLTLWVDASFPYPSIPTNHGMILKTWQMGHVHEPTS